jgi:cysteine desulfurase/selenocysteine lyase
MPLHLRLGLTATARASFYFYNTLEEVEALARAIEETQKVFRKNSRSAKKVRQK